MRSGLCLCLLLALRCAGDAGPTGPATLGAGLRVPDGQENGMVLQDLAEDGPAARAGLRAGDRLLSVDGNASDARILDLVRRACDGHSAAGCAHLAFLYATGRGVPHDDGRALNLYQDACDGGDAAGCYNVGLHFEKARGTLIENTSHALISYRRSCDLGYALGCTNLAFLYEK